MDCHMMVSNPEQVKCLLGTPTDPQYINARLSSQWVDAIAKAGGKLYCFHIEATCEFPHRIPVSHGCPKVERLDNDQRMPFPSSKSSMEGT